MSLYLYRFTQSYTYCDLGWVSLYLYRFTQSYTYCDMG